VDGQRGLDSAEAAARAQRLGTGILLILLTLFNASEGRRQEGKAAAAVAALQKMVIII
jgi:Ca2+-transporting ATPase